MMIQDEFRMLPRAYHTTRSCQTLIPEFVSQRFRAYYITGVSQVLLWGRSAGRRASRVVSIRSRRGAGSVHLSRKKRPHMSECQETESRVPPHSEAARQACVPSTVPVSDRSLDAPRWTGSSADVLGHESRGADGARPLTLPHHLYRDFIRLRVVCSTGPRIRRGGGRRRCRPPP